MYFPQMMHQPFATTREMTVSGNGEIKAHPDYAQIQIEVRTEGDNVSSAQQENTVIMNRVIDSLLMLGIQREEIQTSAYNIFPTYNYIDGKQVLRGYEVQNAITVKIMDISQVGRVIDTATQNGANHISGIQFKIEDVDAYYRKALQFALIDALAKANSMAETMQAKLQTLPIEIIEQTTTATPILYKTLQLSNQQSVTPIEPGVISVTATVQVKFQY